MYFFFVKKNRFCKYYKSNEKIFDLDYIVANFENSTCYLLCRNVLKIDIKIQK